LFAASAMHVRWRLQHAALAKQVEIAQNQPIDTSHSATDATTNVDMNKP